MRIKWIALACTLSISTAASAASYHIAPLQRSSSLARAPELDVGAMLKKNVMPYPPGVQASQVQSLHVFSVDPGMRYVLLKAQGHFYVYKGKQLKHMLSPYEQWQKLVLPHGVDVHDLVVKPDGSLLLATNHGVYHANKLAVPFVQERDFNQGNVTQAAILQTPDHKAHVCVDANGYVDCHIKGQWQQIAGSAEQLRLAKSQHYALQADAPVESLSFVMPDAKKVSQYDPVIDVVYTFTTDNGPQHVKQEIDTTNTNLKSIDLEKIFTQSDKYGPNGGPLLGDPTSTVNPVRLDDPYWYRNHQLGQVEVFIYDRDKGSKTRANVVGYAHFLVTLDQYSPEKTNMAGSINLVPAQPGGAAIRGRYGWGLDGAINNGDYQLTFKALDGYDDTQPLSDNEAVSVPLPEPSPSSNGSSDISLQLYYGPTSSGAYQIYTNGNTYLKMQVDICDTHASDKPLTSAQVLSGLTLYDNSNHPVQWQSLASLPKDFFYTNVQGPYDPTPLPRLTSNVGADPSFCSTGSDSSAVIYLRADRVTNSSSFYAVYRYRSSLPQSYGHVNSINTKADTLSEPVNGVLSPYIYENKNFTLNQCKLANPDNDYYGFTAQYRCQLTYNPSIPGTGQPANPSIHDIQFVKFIGFPFENGDKKGGSPYRLIMPYLQRNGEQESGPWTASFYRPQLGGKVADETAGTPASKNLRISLKLKGHDIYGDEIQVSDIGETDSKTQAYVPYTTVSPGDLSKKEGGVIAAIGATSQALCGSGYDSGTGACGTLNISKLPPVTAGSKTKNVIWPDNYLLLTGDFTPGQDTSMDGWKQFVKSVDAYTAESVDGFWLPAHTAVGASGGGDGGIVQYVNDQDSSL